MLRAWRERERAREAADLARTQAEQRETLLEKQTAQTSQHAQREPAAAAAPQQPPPSFVYRPPKPAYWRERIRRANQSEAAREREEANARYHDRVMRDQNTESAPRAARPEPDIKPSSDPAAWWTDPKARDPARPEPDAKPKKTPEQELLERLRQRERERKAREREQERQPGRSIADDWLDGMLNKKDGPK